MCWTPRGSYEGRRPRPELRSIRTGCKGLYGSIPCPPNPVYVLFDHTKDRIHGTRNRAARHRMEPPHNKGINLTARVRHALCFVGRLSGSIQRARRPCSQVIPVLYGPRNRKSESGKRLSWTSKISGRTRRSEKENFIAAAFEEWFGYEGLAQCAAFGRRRSELYRRNNQPATPRQ
jgi:hypothetical protein